MAMTRKDWLRRYYAPLPNNIVLVHVDHRDDELNKVYERVMDLHSFGQFLYHDVIAQRRGGKPFTGYPAWFGQAVKGGWVPRPNKPFPLTATNQALTIFNCHTKRNFEAWAEHARTVTVSSYLSFLRRQKRPISLVPITDPFTREQMARNKRA